MTGERGLIIGEHMFTKSEMTADSLRVFLAPAEYVDSDDPAVLSAAMEIAPRGSASEKARAFFYAVRDLRYQAKNFDDLGEYRASSVLKRRRGYCVGKAALFVALCRAASIPARAAFANVRNHLASPRLREMMNTDLFAWHGYAEVALSGHWVKVSPTFDARLCRRYGVTPLEFDGESDALLQSFDNSGRSMTYVNQHGAFHDIPARFLVAELNRLYPRVCTAMREGTFSPDREQEAQDG